MLYRLNLNTLPPCCFNISNSNMRSRPNQKWMHGLQSPTPIFNYMREVTSYKGFISCSYSMLLNKFLPDSTAGVIFKWEGDIGAFEEDQWEKALAAVPRCSLNVAQRLSQLYLLLRVHYTPARLVRMGVRDDPSCTRCMRDHGDLIHMLWRCPKLHIYWKDVLGTINQVFKVHRTGHPKLCLLGILDDVPEEEASLV